MKLPIKLKKLAYMMGTGSCLVLTQCTSISKTVPTVVVPPQPTSPFADKYPHARTHQDDLDPFLHGEYDRPGGLAGASNIDTAARIRPDDGIDNYPDERMIDRFRWLEQVDPVDPNHSSDPIYGHDKAQARERNLLGSRLEDPTKEQFDNRTQVSIKTPTPNRPKSEVTEWVEAQHDVTMDYLTKIPYYGELKQRIDEMWNVADVYSEKFYKGVGYIKVYRDGKDGFKKVTLQGLDGTTREILNESTVGEGRLPTTRFDRKTSPKVNKDGKYLAYSIIQNSADADEQTRVLYIMEIATGKIVYTVNKANVEDLEWDEDNPNVFIYAKWIYDNSNVLYRHDLSKPSFEDEILVNGWEELNLRIDEIKGFYGEDKDKNRYLVLKAGLQIPTTVIKDMKTGYIYRLDKQDYFRKNNVSFARDYTFGANFVHFEPKTLDVWIISTENSGKAQLIKTNLKNLDKREVVIDLETLPGNYDFLMEAEFHDEGKGYFITILNKDVSNKVILFDIKGKLIKDLTPVELGEAKSLKSHIAEKPKKDGKKDDKKDKDESESLFAKEDYVEFQYSTPVSPWQKYRYSISKDKMIDVRYTVPYPINSDAYEVKRVFYTSFDHMQVPMLIVHKKGIKLDGKNPTFLYAYGGFGVRGSMGFNQGNLPWLEAGGVYAEAYIRGGGEYNREWHKAAEQHRMVHFGDVNAAADYLKQAGYGDSEHLAVNGGSNGGLMAGGAMVLAPEKYRVAIPEMGVLDMYRFDSMYRNDYWFSEYGLSWGPRAMREDMKKWSPYQNVKSGVCYPSTLVVVPKRDDRVWPAHSYKFTAALQEQQACDRPILMYAIEGEGHNPITLEGYRDRYLRAAAFGLYEMGVKELPPVERPSIESFKTDVQKREEERKELIKKAKLEGREIIFKD